MLKQLTHVNVWVDDQDIVWIIHRSSASLNNNERGAELTPPTGECCRGAPPVLAFDQAGNLVRHWGGPVAGAATQRRGRHSAAGRHDSRHDKPRKSICVAGDDVRGCEDDRPDHGSLPGIDTAGAVALQPEEGRRGAPFPPTTDAATIPKGRRGVGRAFR